MQGLENVGETNWLALLVIGARTRQVLAGRWLLGRLLA